MNNDLMEMDAFTRNQIINEYEGILFVKDAFDTKSVEHFGKERVFDMNEFYGGFLLVIAIISFIGYFS